MSVNLFFPVLMNIAFATNTICNTGSMQVVEISQNLLLQAKMLQPTNATVKALAEITEEALIKELSTDDLNKTFWINIYNASTQIILSANPTKYRNRGSFFKDKQINVAGNLLSLDEIEHGILRRSKIKWSLGYLNKWFISAFEKQHRVKTVDYRIHFSLNCGAKSCPPIAFYTAEQLNKQLDLATNAYLQTETIYNEAENTITLPAIMGWFRGDFGGKKSMLALLQQRGILPKGKKTKIQFGKYDWNLFLENYKSE